MPNDWTLDDGRVIRLLTPAQFDALPDGSVLYAIDGDRVVKGTDPIDGDTRFGHLAFGPLIHTPRTRPTPPSDAGTSERETETRPCKNCGQQKHEHQYFIWGWKCRASRFVGEDDSDKQYFRPSSASESPAPAAEGPRACTCQHHGRHVESCPRADLSRPISPARLLFAALPGAEAGTVDALPRVCDVALEAADYGGYSDVASAEIRRCVTALSSDHARLTAQLEGVSHALESLVDTDMAHDDPAYAASIVAQMVDASRAEVARLTEANATLSDFARTAPGRLPQHVQDALSPWRAARLASPSPTGAP